MAIKHIPLNDICISHTQTRATINMEVVDDYAERMGEGDIFPPARVFSTSGAAPFYLSRGFHRIHAAKKCGFVDIEAEVMTGGIQDAIMDGASDNVIHGLRRSNEDKARAVKMFIEAMVIKGENLSDREIARRVGVDHKTVTQHRPKSGGEFPHLGKRTGADGKAYSLPEKRSCPKCGARMAAGDKHDACPICRGERKLSSKDDPKPRYADDEGATGIPEGDGTEPFEAPPLDEPGEDTDAFDRESAVNRLHRTIRGELIHWPDHLHGEFWRVVREIAAKK